MSEERVIRNLRNRKFRIRDVAPTILNFLDFSIPNDSDGIIQIYIFQKKIIFYKKKGLSSPFPIQSLPELRWCIHQESYQFYIGNRLMDGSPLPTYSLFPRTSYL